MMLHMDNDLLDEKPVFNRTVSLHDEWAKIEKKSRSGAQGSWLTDNIPIHAKTRCKKAIYFLTQRSIFP